MLIKLSRKVPARTETVTVEWYKREFLRYTESFRNIRSRSRQKFDRCFWCKHRFEDNEMFGLAHFVGVRGNKSLCGKCVDMIESTEKQSSSEAGSEVDISEELLNAPVAFGLKAQGHLEKIEQMLSNGILWPDIAAAIGWCPATARCHFELASGDGETKDLRAALATAIEVLREMARKYNEQMGVCERNACAAAYSRGNRLLASRTPGAFP